MYTINEFALESERFDDFEAELKSKILSLIFFSLLFVLCCLWCMFLFFYLKKLQSGLFRRFFASVVLVLLCTDEFLFTKIYSSVHAR